MAHEDKPPTPKELDDLGAQRHAKADKASQEQAVKAARVAENKIGDKARAREADALRTRPVAGHGEPEPRNNPDREIHRGRGR